MQIQQTHIKLHKLDCLSYTAITTLLTVNVATDNYNNTTTTVITARSEMRKILFFSDVCDFLFVNQYLVNRWTDLLQTHREDVFGLSLGGVWMSRSKVKVTRNKKRAVHSHYPRRRRNGSRSLQIMSRTSRRSHSVAAGGLFRRLACGLCLVKYL